MVYGYTGASETPSRVCKHTCIIESDTARARAREIEHRETKIGNFAQMFLFRYSICQFY